MSSAVLMVVSGGDVRNRNYSMAKILYEAKRRRRNSSAWGVARNTLIRFRLPYARTAAGLSPFDDPAPGRRKRTPPAGTPSPAISRNLAHARLIVDVLIPNCLAISGTVRPRVLGHPKTTATTITAKR